MDPRVDGFHEDSEPYLVPTEHPWEALSHVPLGGRRILTVSGSGDIPIYLASQGPAFLQAVDVSRRACFLTELKRAAYRHLSRFEFLHFFFGGMASAASFLERAPEGAAIDFSDRSSLYHSLRQDLSGAARDFFDARMMTRPAKTNPFAEFLRPTDVFHGELFPPLGSEEAYRLWSAGARRQFPVLGRSLEDFLAVTRSCFDLVYTSNVFEYVRARHVLHASAATFRRFMRSFWDVLHRVLAPGGRVGFYVCQGHETQPFAGIVKELAPPHRMRYKRCLAPVTLRPRALPGAVWRHAVVFFEKPSP